MISALDMTIQKSSVSDKRTASRMDMASLLAAQQLLAGSGGASLSASQQQQLVGKQRNQNLSLSIDQDSWQECFIFSAATNEQQFAAVVSNAATATACQVSFVPPFPLNFLQPKQVCQNLDTRQSYLGSTVKMLSEYC